MSARTPAPATVLGNLDLQRARVIPCAQIEVINRHNPRGRYSKEEAFTDEGLHSLAASIRERGVLQPVLLRLTADGRYELVAGERRFRAAQLAGLSGIPAIVEQVADADLLEYALIENLQREAMNPVDQTFGMLELLSQRTGYSLRDLPAYLNRLRNGTEADEHRVEETLQQVGGWTLLTFATRNVKFLNLNEAELEAVAAGRLTSTAAFELLPLGQHEQRGALLDTAIREGWSAKDVRHQVKQLLQATDAPSEAKTLVARVKIALTERRVSGLSTETRHQLAQLVDQMETLLNTQQETRPTRRGRRDKGEAPAS